jgi:hypothetical protein
MDISIATSRPATTEANTVNSLVPGHLREGAENFIGFLEDYYSYMNTDGLPSQEINNILTEQDIDQTSTQYMDLIQAEIARNIPRAAAFDRVSLYKKIVKYYLTKGSEDSIINFFKIFYDDAISIQYPRDSLFKPSSGDYNGSIYRDVKGFASNTDVLQDSYFWQDFSYVINSSIAATEWKNEFNKLVHPAGFKFFAILSLLIVRRSNWIGRFVRFNTFSRNYESALPDNYRDLYKTRNYNDLDWLKGLTPPHKSSDIDKYSDNVGDHMPMFQYGLLGNIVTRNIFALKKYDDATFDRIVIHIIYYLSNLESDQYITTRNDYLSNLKFLDTDGISEYKNTPIEFGLSFKHSDVKFPLTGPLAYSSNHLGREGDFIIDQSSLNTITLIQEGGNHLVNNYERRKLFSNISSFITTIDTSPPIGITTISGINIVTLQQDDQLITL